jgi:hypothetical protein
MCAMVVDRHTVVSQLLSPRFRRPSSLSSSLCSRLSSIADIGRLKIRRGRVLFSVTRAASQSCNFCLLSRRRRRRTRSFVPIGWLAPITRRKQIRHIRGEASQTLRNFCCDCLDCRHFDQLFFAVISTCYVIVSRKN